ncbi:hypothetical protein [Thalassoglobus polymorphus]|uniref:Uncharacterized protein n=1 Tax=Thalassoglobus polymorphus TaxID=2527994 RepID=A0A517QTM9_9PLAN|nr:hypothetical protein [Thalassoglobus polymorphus]QDT34897.1 hypothetical protein Mal48_41700 [Thalassoglobus polymorphus]
MFSVSLKMTAAVVAVSMFNTAMAQSPHNGRVQQTHLVQAPGNGYVAPHGHGGAHYPQLNAPLYPSPVQYTPSWNGGAIITNQAFAPHEMLYPHEYHAMYGPYYYNVKGGWIWTPFGMRQHEQVKLEGTEVIVKYKSHRPLFSGFRPPR